MNTPLIDHLTNELRYPLLDVHDFDHFIKRTPQCVLFFTENPSNFPESNDVAVILPELMRHFGDHLTPAVIARNYEHEACQRYGVREWPTLIFMRHGKYLGAIARMQNWQDYLRQIGEILEDETHSSPVIRIPLVATQN